MGIVSVVSLHVSVGLLHIGSQDLSDVRICTIAFDAIEYIALEKTTRDSTIVGSVDGQIS